MIRNASTMLLALGLVAGAAGCDIDQTREAELPQVDVHGGQLPSYEVETPEVEFGTRTEQVEVPEVEVRTRTEEVEVPTVDVDMPDRDEDER